MAAVKLGSKQVGDVVKIKIDGTPREFIIVQQGLPSDSYDSSCNGTWLLMKDVLETHVWHESANAARTSYRDSLVNRYLGANWTNKLDSKILERVKSVKIPYCSDAENRVISSGSSGLSVKVFLLSFPEVGLRNNSAVADGTVLEYFKNTSTNARRIAYLGNDPIRWWTRTLYGGNVRDYIFFVNTDGGQHDGEAYGNEYGVRPAFILPSTLMVSDDGAVITNQPPTVPSSITVPSAVYGGKSVSLSWGASTDPDGNLEGYIVERSVNGGSSWAQIYQGTARTTTNTVPFGTAAVTYRVKAYDSEGEFSAYKTSPARTVINNNAPGAPSGVTVPEQVQGGGQLAVSWGAATDSDGNLSGYSLERQVDGGAWTEVYSGAELSFTDSIPKGQWQTLAYRVRACDSYGEYSGYTASATRAVNNNTPPVISCGETELGVKSTNFSVTYQVDDEEEDPVTVTELLDGAQLRSFQAELNGDNTFSVAGEDFLKLQNGPHSMKVSATDGMGESLHELSFTKEITSASVTLSEPMEADGKITLCALSVKGEFPEDAALTVEVTNNAKDEAPVWEDCTTQAKNGLNHIFENETAQNGFAFNFRVNASRGESGQGGYITSVQGGFQ